MDRPLGEYPDLGPFLSYLGTRPLLRGAIGNIDLLHRKYGDEYLRFASELLGVTRSIGVDPGPVFEAYIYEYLRDLV